jgi:hypothetical protein
MSEVAPSRLPNGLGLRCAAALLALILLLTGATQAPTAQAQTAGSCQFTLGFATLHALIQHDQGADAVGPCQEDAYHDAVGNAYQHTRGGLLVWRKAHNWTGFTDGNRTWINSPFGLLVRLNTERFAWESQRPVGGDPLAMIDLRQAYRHAVEDARDAELEEIVHDLIPLVEGNPHLVWRDTARGPEVLVVTWTDWEGYLGREGQPMTTTRETWVTAVPELLEVCRAERPTEPALRLQQLLGLPPLDRKRWFAELWVRPADLFRPTPDPDVTTREAPLDFPASGTVPPEHVAWIDDLTRSSYGENGYPWTRLGYTYDWGNPASEVGLSEFVLKPQSSIEVYAVTGTADYCLAE